VSAHIPPIAFYKCLHVLRVCVGLGPLDTDQDKLSELVEHVFKAREGREEDKHTGCTSRTKFQFPMSIRGR
jgi:hypothetical protein